MTKYLIVSDAFDGNVTCYYDSKGLLTEFVINSWNIKEDDHRELLSNLGYMLTDVLLKDFAAREGFKWRAARIDLSFERFWVMYGHARNKTRAEKIWNAMSDKAKYHALLNLKGYLRYCKRNTSYTQMYPDTYLREHTMDNWDRVPDFKTASSK